jgi:hypothetical protein
MAKDDPLWPGSVRSAAQTLVQVSQILLEIAAVLLPRHPIDSSRCVLLQLQEMPYADGLPLHW